ncbi:MAG: ergothioneine biosynthesis protein EgtB [Candidatus Hydrogenedentes bacterium]|nr:ergothioneine biosynthesis protein EgtB [Candidatus Hydrogenedentota bacterium]
MRAQAPQTDPAEVSLRRQYTQVRSFSHLLCEPLVTEDYVIQSMPDVSPTKWHLAHTTWFFETFVLKPYVTGYRPFAPLHEFLFNSYYNSVGKQYSRPHRGLLSRPTVEQVYEYRAYVDKHMIDFLDDGLAARNGELANVIAIGLNHEQQHQELILTDIKHVLGINPLHPLYREGGPASAAAVPRMNWRPIQDGIYWIGHEGPGFAYDNEGPRHRALIESCEIATRLVTNSEYLAFMEDGGYDAPTLWLSKGWNWVQEEQRQYPFYWRCEEGGWYQHTMHGYVPVDMNEPVSHVSYYEADAFARWAGARLPLEAEWEVAARGQEITGNFAESLLCHPSAAGEGEGLLQIFGDLWEWTQSPYTAYPGYTPAPGALGEYNGKFMCDQFVLRGGSCATSRSHIRATYRNFFPADAQWQFTGIRLARYC